METSQSTENESEGTSKKSPFDNLSKAELIKKCKGLLVIAQKAKQARDASVEENKILKDDIKNFEQKTKSDKECLKAMQEMIDSLTDGKLESTTIIDKLTKQLKSSELLCNTLNSNITLFQEKITQLDTENLSYQRQIARYTDENDKLLQELEILEKSKVCSTDLELKDLEAQLQLLLKENENLKNAKVNMGREITAIANEVEMKTEETIDMMKNISKGNSYINSERHSIESLQTQLNDITNLNIKLTSDLQSMESKFNMIKKELSNKSDNLTDIKLALQNKCKENEALVSELDKYVLQVSELNSKVTEIDIARTHVLSENEILHNKIKTLQMEIEENNKLVENLKIELTFQIKKLTSEKNEADCKVKKAEIDTSKELKKMQDLEKQIEQLNETIALNIETTKELSNSKSNLILKNKELTQILTQLKTENSKQKKVIDELKHQLGESYNSKRQIEDEMNKLHTLAKGLEDERIIEKNHIINKLESAIQEMDNKIKSTEQEIKTIKSNYDKLNEKYELLSSSKEKLLHKLRTYHHKLTEFATNLKQLKNDKNVLLATMKDYSNTISDWQTKIATISSQLCEKLLECNAESKALQDRILALEAEKQNLLTEESNECIQSLEQLENENIKLNDQIRSVNAEQVEFLKVQVCNFEKDKEILNASNSDLLTKLQVLSNDNSTMSEDIKKLSEEKLSLEQILETLKSSNLTLKLDNENLLKDLNEFRSQHLSVTSLETEIINVKQQLANKITENKELLMEMREINEALKQRGETISKQQERCSEMDRKIQSLETDIKQLSFKLNDKDSQLNESYTQVQENESKIKQQALESNHSKNIVVERDMAIQSLQEEMSKLKDNLNSTFDSQNDALSTSTVSKLEESTRFKDVDSSLEERYSKLRMLALKFKKKIGEQNSQITLLETENQKLICERNEIAMKIAVNAKNMQTLQQEYDKLQDELDDQKSKDKATEKKSFSIQDECKELRLELDAIKEKYSKSQNNAELSQKEKSSVDTTNKEYKSLIYNLRKSLDEESQKNVLHQEEIKKYQEKLKLNEQEVLQLNNNIKSLKDELLESRKEIKRKSVLNLEMDNYEKTLNDMTKKLDSRNTKVKELESTISSNSDTISSLKEQITLLETDLKSEVSHSKDLKDRLNTTQTSLNEFEQQNAEKENEISQLKKSVESLTEKIEELAIELTNNVAEKENVIATCKSEKDSLLRQIYEMENSIALLTENLNKCKSELIDVKAEFSSYKVRAQSVLRQNQFKDVSKEDELLQEIKLLTVNNETLLKDLNSKSNQLDVLKKEHQIVQEEKEKAVERSNEILGILKDIQIQHDILMETNQKLIVDHQEAIKAQKLQNDTLVNCYKQQITELQEQYKKETNEAKLQLEQASIRKKSLKEQHTERTFNAVQEENVINIPLMERGDGEGSESTYSTSPITMPQRRRSQTHSRSNREVIPLDELLNTTILDNNSTELNDNEGRLSPISEIHNIKQLLDVEQCRVKHLTSLLAENEQDLAKLTQLNEVLKEEIRRSQRSDEREKHTQNSEYLKNVIFKFVTLNSGDERSHLVPVLNMLLKLSPEERQKLQDIAKGVDTSAGGRGWGNYLPRWSNQP